jgi:uncharacterized membrane protein
MAGIGFTLRRLLDHDGTGGPVLALTFASTLAAGPWLASSMALATLGVWGAVGATGNGGRVFFGIVTYTFAASLIVVGSIQLVAARYLADRLFANRLEEIATSFALLLMPLMALQTVLGLTFISTLRLGALGSWAVLAMYLAISGTWLALTFLAAARDYLAPVAAFALGMVTGVVVGAWGGAVADLPGQLAGFAAGTAVTFLVLAGRVVHEFGLPGAPAPSLWPYFRRYAPLVIAGLGYNMACWVDKWLFWRDARTGSHVVGAIWAAPVYDDAMFLAYLTVVPALGTFLLVAETGFYEAFRGYFVAIESRAELAAISSARENLGQALWRGLRAVAKVQVPVTAAAILFAPELLNWLNLSWYSLYVFRYGAFGAFLQVLDLFLMVYLLYLNVPTRAMILALSFLFLNATLTERAFGGGLATYGLGYATAGALVFAIGVWLVERSLWDLDYRVFMRQPFEVEP